MFAKKIVPILLVAGAVHMVMHHNQQRCAEQPGDQPADTHRRGPFFARRGEWANRVPPMFELWHKRAHAQEQAAASPAV